MKFNPQEFMTLIYRKTSPWVINVYVTDRRTDRRIAADELPRYSASESAKKMIQFFLSYTCSQCD